MTEELISVIDIVKLRGKYKAYLFKVLKRLKIETIKDKSSEAKGQKISYINKNDYELLIKSLRSDESNSDENTNLTSSGVFYIIQLEPDHDPGRFKLGFATNIEERLRSHKTSAPLSRVVKTWPCMLLWEKTVIDCVSQDCERIYTEVFRTESIDEIQARCEEFLSLMPKIT